MEVVAATLFGLDILLLFSFQVLNRDDPAFAHAVSDYGLGRTARLFKLYVISGSIAAPVLAFQFWQAKSPDYPAAIPAYLLLVMLGRLGIGFFPNDRRGLKRTRGGLIHRGATLLAFTAAFMAISEATPLLANAVTGPMSAGLTALKYTASAGFLAVMLTISAPLRPLFGLAERLFLYAAALWCLLATLALPPL